MNTKTLTKALRVTIDGREWKLYTADYKADASTYSLEFYAINDEHAHAVIQDIRETLAFTGQLYGSREA